MRLQKLQGWPAWSATGPVHMVGGGGGGGGGETKKKKKDFSPPHPMVKGGGSLLSAGARDGARGEGEELPIGRCTISDIGRSEAPASSASGGMVVGRWVGCNMGWRSIVEARRAGGVERPVWLKGR